jgi:hypothetical protein
MSDNDAIGTIMSQLAGRTMNENVNVLVKCLFALVYDAHFPGTGGERLIELIAEQLPGQYVYDKALLAELEARGGEEDGETP